MIKVNRTFPAPISLAEEAQKVNGSYAKDDVIRQLKQDFHNKCYICGLGDLQDPQVEHLRPHKNGQFPERKYDWENLFWSCGHCNSVKNQKKYDENVLDCCKKDPENLISFMLTDEEIQVIARDEEDEEAKTTAMLVTEVFNLKNTGMRVYKSEARFQKLNKEMNKLYDSIEEWEKNPDSRLAVRKIKVLLRRESSFAAFKREYIRVHREQYSDLLGYIYA